MPRAILDTLHHINGGAFLLDAAEQLAELVKRVDQTGKAGTLTLKVMIRKASSTSMAVRGDLSVKMPPEQPFEALLFPTPEGNLLTEDPRQSKLPLVQVHDTPMPLAPAVNS